ncbi:hypothetical protein [Marinibactrum halimedae]|uniref:hypothetical protein n=1 Tax=Marinibactrum halimedae TaxID=1444977 RepID=UPI001E39C7DF|nr:hypothetical protein [Marinibactrum halimedae]MCD9457908.1 hypothetical protein [Marinibactrum halimedae]
MPASHVTSVKYQCLACGYKGLQTAQGKCPACNSAYISSVRKPSSKQLNDGRSWRTYTLAALCLYLVMAIGYEWLF